MILHTALKHGWFYHYRVHRDKLRRASDEFPFLEDFLLSMLDSCPDEHFLSGSWSSALKFSVEAPVKHLPGHEVCSLARFGLANGRFKTAHSNVQVTMLEHDRKTLAVEVPLWVTEEEASQIGLSGSLSGHIDLLCAEQGLLWVWDYKPGASKEKYAHTQTYFYALMLSARTGIPLERMRCGYFDERDCYLFAPSAVKVPSNQVIV